MQEYLQKLLKFRKQSLALQRGQTVHFVPEQGVYLLARIVEDETVVLLLNKNESEVVLPLSRFLELGLSDKPMTEILRGQKVVWSDTLILEGPGAYIYTSK